MATSTTLLGLYFVLKQVKTSYIYIYVYKFRVVWSSCLSRYYPWFKHPREQHSNKANTFLDGPVGRDSDRYNEIHMDKEKKTLDTSKYICSHITVCIVIDECGLEPTWQQHICDHHYRCVSATQVFIKSIEIGNFNDISKTYIYKYICGLKHILNR